MGEKFFLIGAGRVGNALGDALVQRGWECLGVISRRVEPARQMALRVGASIWGKEFELLPENLSHLFLCTPDDALPEVVSQLVRLSRNWSTTFVAHTSGPHSSLMLQALAERGAVVASLHPAMSFTGTAGEWQNLIGGWFALEGDAAGLEHGTVVLSALEARYIQLRPEQKILYHIACVLAANYLVTLHAKAEMLLTNIGSLDAAVDGRALLQNLSRSVLANLETKPAAESLTGPVARGDAGVIAMHLAWLKLRQPQFLPLYVELGKAALALARERKSLDEEAAKKISALFG
jgi:predicted short-subunit dehydrogenase-like oxidoreductase (DUF2520 family)